LSEMPGVVEHGLFIGIAKMAIVGRENTVVEIRAETAKPRRVPPQRARRKSVVQKKSSKNTRNSKTRSRKR
jgi:hypothetical protein